METKDRGYFDNIFLDKFKPGVIIDAGAYKGMFVKDLSEKKIQVFVSFIYLNQIKN